jgi:HEAT repeat protein/Na+/melibiose symporter-like transporter
MTADRPPIDIKRAMNLSIASGAAGTLWMIACAPQAIFNVFVRNHLGATSAQLGLLVGILSFASILQLPAILVYRALPRRKPFWIITSLIHRLNGPVLAAVAFAVAQGANRETAIVVVFAAMITSWVITNVSSSGWWNWMADLVPLSVRARFFGRRSAVAQIVNVAAFFVTTVALDSALGDRQLIVYGVVFLVAGIGGVADILIHLFIPEPRPADDAPVERVSFTAPLADPNFLRFAVITGLVLFSINVSAPFFAPYITDPEAIGAPNTWLGIMFVISQTTWIAVSSGWGTIMDRFGRKPVVMIGLLFTASWIGYLVLSPTNYVVVLPIIAMVGGVLAPAFWDGINQLMLSLTKEQHRITYIAWYWTIIGTVSAGGSILGGVLDDLFSDRALSLGLVTIEGFHVVVVTSLVLVMMSFFVLSRVDEGPVKPVSFVFSRIATPGIFRTFLNIGVLARPDSSDRIARTLRSIDSASDDLAAEEVIGRLGDPDPEVRDEAVRALGRLRSREAKEALIGLLGDPTSGTRAQAARALGRIGDDGAIPYLMEAMDGASEELREACASAIGEIGGGTSIEFMSRLLRDDQSDSVAAGGASALSRHGAFEAAWEIVPRLQRTRNPILRTQLAIALANVLGRPGEFYRYVTGSEEQQAARRRRLAQEAVRSARTVLGRPLDIAVSSTPLDPRATLSILRATAREALVERFASANSALPVDDDELLRATYEDNPRLGLWYWFVNRALASSTGIHESANLRLEMLVALYFLRAATEEPVRDEPPRSDRSDRR